MGYAGRPGRDRAPLGGPPGVAAQIERGTALAELRRDWGRCYRISYGQDWGAARRDDGGELHAGTALTLRWLIEDDHARLPVPLRYREPDEP